MQNVSIERENQDMVEPSLIRISDQVKSDQNETEPTEDAVWDSEMEIDTGNKGTLDIEKLLGLGVSSKEVDEEEYGNTVDEEDEPRLRHRRHDPENNRRRHERRSKKNRVDVPVIVEPSEKEESRQDYLLSWEPPKELEMLNLVYKVTVTHLSEGKVKHKGERKRKNRKGQIKVSSTLFSNTIFFLFSLHDAV